MSTRTCLAVSGTVFGIIAALHLLRVVNGWAVEIGPWPIPIAVSWLGIIVPAVLCVLAARLAPRRGE